MAKSAVFTITCSLKINFDLKQFQKTTMKTWKLVSPRPWIASYVARSDYFDLFITRTGMGVNVDPRGKINIKNFH